MSNWYFDDKKIGYTLIISLAFHILLLSVLGIIYRGRIPKFPEITEITVVGIKTKSKYIPETLAQRNYKFTRDGIITRNIPRPSEPTHSSKIKVPSFASTFQPKFTPSKMKSVSEREDIYRPARVVAKRVKVKKIYTPELKSPNEIFDRFETKKKIYPGRKESEGTEEGKEVTSNIIWLTGEKLNRRLLYKPPLEYPAEARQKTIIGHVKLRFRVKPDGSVFDVSPIVKSDPILMNYAMTALRKYKFEPLPESVTPIIQEGEIIFEFTLFSPH